MMPIAARRPGTRDGDRPATGLYLCGGRGQPVGITALLVTHTISTPPPACRPPEPCWRSPGNTREPARRLSCPFALPIRSPMGTPARVLPG